MKAHPAIAYLVAEHLFEGSPTRHRARTDGDSVDRSRTVKLGRYRITTTKDGAGAARTV